MLRCLNLGINDQPKMNGISSRLPAYARASKFYNIIVDALAISSFPWLLGCEANMGASCHVVVYLQR